MKHRCRTASTRGAALSLAAMLALAWWPTDAGAAVCGTREKIQKILEDRYRESSRGMGLVANKGVVELYISESGTWSILLTTTSGSTCILAAGHTWQDIVAQLDEPSA